MTGDATALRSGVAGQVLRVIEVDVEVFFKAIGKNLCAVDRCHSLTRGKSAHRNIWRGELGQVTKPVQSFVGKLAAQNYPSDDDSLCNRATRASNSCRNLEYPDRGLRPRQTNTSREL
jgi:hypothetical protein